MTPSGGNTELRERLFGHSHFLCVHFCVSFFLMSPAVDQVDRVDRLPPSLTTRRSPSTVVELASGRYGIFITSKHLQASDPDSPVEELEFSIARPPHFGYLENGLTGGPSVESSCPAMSSMEMLCVQSDEKVLSQQELTSKVASPSGTWTSALWCSSSRPTWR